MQVTISVAPMLRIWIERQPVHEEEWKSLKFFDEWRMFGIETKISFAR